VQLLLTSGEGYLVLLLLLVSLTRLLCAVAGSSHMPRSIRPVLADTIYLFCPVWCPIPYMYLDLDLDRVYA
jgi:hypothetical protein